MSGFAALSHVRFSNGQSDSDTQFGLGANLGTKIPVLASGFVRLEAGFFHELEGDFLPSRNTLTLSVGLGAILN